MDELVTDEGRYRLLLDAITDYAIYMLDPAGVVTSWNAGAARAKGYAADEIIGRHFSLFYTPEDRSTGMPDQALSTAARAGRFEREGWRVRKDGHRFWAHVIIDAIRDPSGRLIGFAKVTRDLTERKAAEDALHHSEEQFRLLVQSVTDYAIYRLDREGRVASWNAGAERIKLYRPDEIIGEHFSRFYSEEDRASGLPQRGLETAGREGRFESEGWRVRKDGSRFWAHVIIDAIHDERGQLVGFAKVTRDITERRATQEALQQAQQALFQSQKLESIGQLTGGVAHDFNNLLMAVLGSLELMRKRLPDDPKLQALLENAAQGAQRGVALTQRMLAFARRQELKREAVDLSSLVRGMRGLLERSLGPMIEIVTRFPPGLEAVETDPNQLEAAILNLAVNARDAMPEGGRITIGAEPADAGEGDRLGLPAGCYIRLVIADTGQGMDEATLARATEPFFTTKGVGKGTGLGLSMVHGLVEQSGGRLVLESKLGEGVTASLWLPVSLNDTAPAPPCGRVEPIISAPTDKRMTVLAVDDDSLVLMSTAAMLEDLGYAVVEASSGQTALEIVDQDPSIGLVISDQAMPGMTGFQLATAIRERRRDLPVILATGFAEAPPGAPSLPRLAKPFTQAQLAEALAEVVKP